ncbi:hypothetical protein [Streptomyces sp. NPDC056010]|uniref:hypothetical protein n=1 Tax=Streptomyces sp. NPDC056010 TaxID=3345679 RepID=UPI0035DC1D8F
MATSITSVRGPVRLLGCVVLAVFLTACQAGKEQEKPKMDMKQAGQRAEEILDDTMEAIQPSVKWVRGVAMVSPCSTNLNEPTGTTTVVRSRNILTVVSERRRDELLKMVQRHWKKRGATDFDVHSDEKMPRIRAKTADGLTVTLDVGYAGNVYIRAAFGCAQDSAMTYPKGTPGQPGGPDEPERIPREHSSYWSVGS